MWIRDGGGGGRSSGKTGLVWIGDGVCVGGGGVLIRLVLCG